MDHAPLEPGQVAGLLRQSSGLSPFNRSTVDCGGGYHQQSRADFRSAMSGVAAGFAANRPLASPVESDITALVLRAHRSSVPFPAMRSNRVQNLTES